MTPIEILVGPKYKKDKEAQVLTSYSSNATLVLLEALKFGCNCSHHKRGISILLLLMD